MKTIVLAARSFLHKRPSLFIIVCVLGLAVLLMLLAAPAAGANDVYSNIGPAPQLPAGGLVGRYPLANYELDQYFPGISVGLTSGVDVSGVAPLIAYFIAQVIWMITAFVANAVITLFAFAFNLDLVNGNGTPGSGALTPISTAIHNLYASTFGAPWLVAMVVIVGCWAMWKALVQRRYTETAGALAISLLYFVLAIGIVTQPERTIGPASKLSNEVSTALLSLTNQGSVDSESRAKSAASNQLFELLILNPWTVLEFGGIEQCTSISGGKTSSVAVRPLSNDPTRDTQLAAQLEAATEVQAEGKRCINDRNKYASHFLAYPFQSHDRNSEHEALENGDDADLPESDAAKHNGSYPLGKADEPAAEAMGKGGQYQRLLLAILILLGELGAFALLGALTLGVILAQVLLLTMLAFAPVALLVGIFPGRGHEFFSTWLTKLAGYLARKVIYSLILAVLLAVCQALTSATSNLGWLLAFTLQAAFLWTIFLQRRRLTTDFLAATVGPKAGQEATSRLQTLYYTTRLARMAMGRSHRQSPQTTASPEARSRESLPPSEPPSSGGASSGHAPPDGGGSPPPPHEAAPSSGGVPPRGGSPAPHETPTHGRGSSATAAGAVPATPPTTGENACSADAGPSSEELASPAADSRQPTGDRSHSPDQPSVPAEDRRGSGGSQAPVNSPARVQDPPPPATPSTVPETLPAPSAPPPGFASAPSDDSTSLRAPGTPTPPNTRDPAAKRDGRDSRPPVAPAAVAPSPSRMSRPRFSRGRTQATCPSTPQPKEKTSHELAH